MNINYRDIKYFEVIAEYGNVGLAADKLGRTQPALSKAVQRLEEALGCQLFERIGRGIRITPVGEVLLARARLLRGATEEILREVQDFSRGQAGHVRIGSGPIAADYALPEICNLLLAQANDTTIDITTGPSLMLRELLKKGSLDLLIGLMSEGDDALVSHPIIEDVVVVATSRNHPVFQLEKITVESLLQWNWVLPLSTIPSRQWLDSAFLARGLQTPKVQINANSIPLLPRLIAHNELLSFLSRHTLVKARESGEMLQEVPLKELRLHRKLGVTYRKSGYLSPAAQRLLELLQQQGSRLFGLSTPERTEI